MPKVITAAHMRRLEEEAVKHGTTMDALMERAGAALTAVVRRRYIDDAKAPHALILCGGGNNGGDGYVVARLLAEQVPECRVTVVPLAPPSTPLSIEKAALLPASVTVCDGTDFGDNIFTVAVDAVYGIGFRGILPPAQKALFSRLRDMTVPVVAADIPSGIHADTGVADSDGVIADITVTFTALKPAMVLASSVRFGDIMVADVGIASDLKQAFETDLQPVTETVVSSYIRPRPADGHKGTFGRVLTVCGSYGMAGAALLCGKAVLRSGAGLVHMAIPQSIYPICASALWEAVYHPLPETENGTLGMMTLLYLQDLIADKQAAVIGCGLSKDPETKALLETWLPTLTVPTVIDADGLNLLAPHILLLKAMTAPLVLTPHPAEAARLLGVTTADVERDRVGAVQTLAKRTGATVVLKGHRSLIASPEGSTVYINTTGNSGMATGGSGDVLSGMIAALLASGMTTTEAALCGVYLHGAAGDEAAAKRSETALLPSDLLDELSFLLSHFEKRE